MIKRGIRQVMINMLKLKIEQAERAIFTLFGGFPPYGLRGPRLEKFALCYITQGMT